MATSSSSNATNRQPTGHTGAGDAISRSLNGTLASLKSVEHQLAVEFYEHRGEPMERCRVVAPRSRDEDSSGPIASTSPVSVTLASVSPAAQPAHYAVSTGSAATAATSTPLRRSTLKVVRKAFKGLEIASSSIRGAGIFVGTAAKVGLALVEILQPGFVDPRDGRSRNVNNRVDRGPQPGNASFLRYIPLPSRTDSLGLTGGPRSGLATRSTLSQQVKCAMMDALRENPDIADKQLEKHFETLLVAPPSKQVSHIHPILLVLDALDETDEGKEAVALIEFIDRHLPSLPPNVKFILKSLQDKGVSEK
ncbi:hypothetical protein FRB90_011353 [Tulasnella sp. 427]|nr:hypothetical protein FRB90_011353 [Tulasnella sp. 427]